MSELELNGLEVSFGGIRALRGIALDLEQGEIVSLIGPNGAGKTTVLNAICRMVEASRGSISYRGQDITRVRPHLIARLGIARTFQNIHLLTGATVLENLMTARHTQTPMNPLAALVYSHKAKQAELRNRERVEEILAFLGLQRFRRQAAGELPYGIQKVVELARALCLEPKMLLLDEPAAGLDTEEVADMALWIQDINRRRGATILMIEHNMNLVARVSDRVVVLDQGRILTQGTPESVQASPDVARAYLGMS